MLLSWKRPYHIPEIVESLRGCRRIHEIVVWCNEVPPTPEILQLGVRVFHSPKNIYTLGRFLGARHAKFSRVYVQDDDLIVKNVDEVIDVQIERGGIVANLADDESSRHWNWWQINKPQFVELGFGSVFPTLMAWSLEGWPFERDVLERKADKVFTVLNPWTAIPVKNLVRLRHDGKESGRDGNALWMRGDHKRLTEEAVELAKKWRSEKGVPVA